MKKIRMIAFICLLTLSLCACSFQVGELYPDADRYSAGDAVISEKVETLIIDWASGSVTIEPGDGEAIELRETGNQPTKEEQQLQYYLDGTTLHVRFCASAKVMVGIMAEKSLRVTLPKDLVLKELDVSTASAELHVADARAERMKLGTASGEISGTVAYAGELRLGSASGEIDIAASGEIEKLEGDTASGAIRLRAESVRELEMDSASGKLDVELASAPRECELENASGDISLRLPADAEFTAEVDTASGDFNCDFPTVRHGDSYICGNGSAELSFDTASGNITIIKKD